MLMVTDDHTKYSSDACTTESETQRSRITPGLHRFAKGLGLGLPVALVRRPSRADRKPRRAEESTCNMYTQAAMPLGVLGIGYRRRDHLRIAGSRASESKSPHLPAPSRAA
jgi:hypothetical protein